MQAGPPITTRTLLVVLCLGPALVAALAVALPSETELPDVATLEALDLLLAAAALAAWVLAAVFVRVPRLPEKFCLPLAFLLAIAPVVIASLSLPTPVSNDERAYLLQAEMFATGRATLPLVEPSEPLRRRQIHEDPQRGVIYSKYPPGTAVSLTPGAIAGRPGWMVALAGGIAVLLIAAIARRLELARPASTALVFAACPFFLLLQTSFQSQVFTIPVVLAGYALLLRLRAEPRRSLACGLALGACAGWVLVSRPLTGVVFAVAMLPGLLARGRDGRSPGVRALAGAVAGGLPFAAGMLLYNRALTGDPWLTPYAAYAAAWSPWDVYPLFRSAFFEAPLVAIAQGLLRQLARWLPAVFGVLGAAGLGAFGLWRLRGRDGGAGLVFTLMLPIAYALHWYPGHWAYLGPIYAAESLGLLVVGAVVVIDGAPEGWSRALPAIAVAAGLALFVERFASIEQQVDKRIAPVVVAASAGLSNDALVLLPRFNKPERQEQSLNRYTASQPPFTHGVVYLHELDSPARTRAAIAALGLSGRRVFRFVPDTMGDGGRVEAYSR